jgi:long-subunit fatty acid transport protein
MRWRSGSKWQGAVLACLVLAWAGLAAAQTKTGTTIGQFVGIEPSARIAAMGNAGWAIYDGVQSVFYNPGALGSLDKIALQFTHGFWFADIRYDYVAAVIPEGNLGNFLFSVTSLNSGDIAVRTVTQPLGTGEFYDVTDLALGLGYGRQITDRFEAGLQFNYVAEQIWHSKMSAITVSLGTMYRLNDRGLTLGASLVNFGTKGRFDGRDLAIQWDRDPSAYGDNSALPAGQFTDDFPMPILFRVGMSYPRRLSDSSKLLLAVDAFHPSDNTEGFDLGWEWTWKEAFSLRAGYQDLYQKDSEFGLTAGLGLQGALGPRHFAFDYAWAYHLHLQETHRLTFVLLL